MIDLASDEYFMREAIKEAHKAYSEDEVPVGAIIVSDTTKQIIARGHNLTERLADITAHAEMQAITAAAEASGGKFLKNCTLYVTLEPCVMCAGALYWSQIERVVFGAYDVKRGAGRYQGVYHPKTKVSGGLLESECSELLVNYFKGKR